MGNKYFSTCMTAYLDLRQEVIGDWAQLHNEEQGRPTNFWGPLQELNLEPLIL
jgi:hypothetical protein